ncbi:MAG: hypothetical protein ACI8Z1_000858 [Candidatus Azotimanducaceae bacterium]|jgi:hypothetical protein
MAQVKGSKQHQMVVVPHRPLYKSLIFIAFLVALGAFSFFTYQFGEDRGMALRVEAVRERDRISNKLADSTEQIDDMRQQIADLEVGGQIDDRATEEVRVSIEELQDQIAQLNEEIRFYKGVMLPNAAEKGLRIERLDITSNSPGRFKYSVLLTQVVDKHDFVQGGVEISLLGRAGDQEQSFLLSELDTEKQEAIRFRFRYFQNINGELMLPEGFEPREVMIVAQSSGTKTQRLEKRFNWPLNGG